MSREQSTPPSSADRYKLPSQLYIVLILIFLAVTWWQNNRQPQLAAPVPNSENPNSRSTAPVPDDPAPSPTDHRGTSTVPDEDAPSSVELSPERHEVGPPVSSPVSQFLVKNQTIRDLDGNVVFQGTIDLTPTLDRIERGGTNRHRNDGTTFQNREGRLPRKPAGYYKEYVHPTPGEHGPGPQRVILGQHGEIWYTGDHYKTFHEIKPVNHPQ